MSIQYAVQLPNGTAPQKTDDSVHPDATEGGPSGPSDPKSEAGRTSSTASLWDKEQDFHNKENQRRRVMDKTIGDKSLEAASPLDSEGGKIVGNAAGKSGVPMPSRHTLLKVNQAVKDNPAMKQLQSFISYNLSGKGIDLAAPNGANMVMKLAASAGRSTGLITAAQAKAFGAPNQAVSKDNATQPGALGEAAGQTTPTPMQRRALMPLDASGNAPVGDKKVANDATPDGADAWLAGGNISAIIMLACANSMDADNKTKAGQINEMQKFNQISQLISSYISNVLVPAQNLLDKKTEGVTDSKKVTAARVTVNTWNDVDTNNLFQDKDGNFSIHKDVISDRLSSAGLSSALSAAQGWATTASNNNEQASNRFQATDNHANQTFTMLTGLLKAINDSASAITRNIA